MPLASVPSLCCSPRCCLRFHAASCRAPAHSPCPPSLHAHADRPPFLLPRSPSRRRTWQSAGHSSLAISSGRSCRSRSARCSHRADRSRRKAPRRPRHASPPPRVTRPTLRTTSRRIPTSLRLSALPDDGTAKQARVRGAACARSVHARRRRSARAVVAMPSAQTPCVVMDEPRRAQDGACTSSPLPRAAACRAALLPASTRQYRRRLVLGTPPRTTAARRCGVMWQGPSDRGVGRLVGGSRSRRQE